MTGERVADDSVAKTLVILFLVAVSPVLIPAFMLLSWLAAAVTIGG